jgi:hypothetical protein
LPQIETGQTGRGEVLSESVVPSFSGFAVAGVLRVEYEAAATAATARTRMTFFTGVLQRLGAF